MSVFPTFLQMILINVVVDCCAEPMPTCPLQLLAMKSLNISASSNRRLEKSSRNDRVSSVVATISCYGDVGESGVASK